jgi:predicted site-specific integrase-resolvase
MRGSRVAEVVNEIASGVHDRRSKVLGLRKHISVTRMVVEHRERLTRLALTP